MKTYFGFGMADNMFPANCSMTRLELSPEEAKSVIAEGVEVCLNPSHALTIRVMQTRYGIDVAIPEKAPFANLKSGDRLLVMGVSGLPRLEGRHEYTPEEIESAKFRFGLWTVTS
ncbi:MAG: hypothetical protein WCK01_03220 [Candidatus Uhrbacteria bacterium]